jgi:subtilase family serine protease
VVREVRGAKGLHVVVGRATIALVLVMTSTSLIAGVAAPSAMAGGAKLPAIQVDPMSAGIHHPLSLEVLGYDVNGAPLVTNNTTPSGYTPATIKKYLGLTGTGSGQTIAIVDAYDHPTIASDLAVFDTKFGLSAPPSFKKVTQTGGTSSYPAVNATWALEIALDVEWAHAIAPAASILLVEAKSTTYADMTTAISYAAKQSAVTVISNSWGSPEFNGESTLDTYCKQTAKLCVFSTGDDGNPGSYPAYNPYVLSVGGTTLNLSTDATTGAVSVASEVAWSGSGGGVSLYEAKPAYQTATNSYTKRGTSDVSYDADPATGFAVYDSVAYANQTGWFQMGGTSAGAPQWAGIIAAANQLRKTAGKAVLSGTSTKSAYMANSTIYALTSGLADITAGPSNGLCGEICTPKVGYDFVTGRGSPRVGIDLALKAAP